MRIHGTPRPTQTISKEGAEDLRIAEKLMDKYADLCRRLAREYVSTSGPQTSNPAEDTQFEAHAVMRRWVPSDGVWHMHDRAIERFGGGHGVRNQGTIEAAMMRPQWLARYNMPDPAELAAGYVHGLVKNHGSMDGNQRTALLVVLTFLYKNKHQLNASDDAIFDTLNGVANNTVGQTRLAAWLRQHLEPPTGSG